MTTGRRKRNETTRQRGQYVLQMGEEVEQRTKSTNRNDMSLQGVTEEQNELLRQMQQIEQEEETTENIRRQNRMIRSLMENYHEIRDKQDNKSLKEKRELQDKIKQI